MAIKLVMVDEHPVYLLGLQYLLSNYPQFEVAATCSGGENLLRMVREYRPDILVLDLCLSKINSLDLIRAIQSEEPRPMVVIVTASLDENQLLEAIRLGVRGVILKNMIPDLFIRCLEKVYAGGEWLENRATSLVLEKLMKRDAERQNLANRLTPREAELLNLLAGGLRNQDIARQMFVSEGTVKAHLHKVFKKLQVKNRVELSVLARNNGWV